MENKKIFSNDGVILFMDKSEDSKTGFLDDDPVKFEKLKDIVGDEGFKLYIDSTINPIKDTKNRYSTYCVNEMISKLKRIFEKTDEIEISANGTFYYHYNGWNSNECDFGVLRVKNGEIQNHYVKIDY